MGRSTRYDSLLIVDLEATCWEQKLPGQISEIIEIGYCHLNKGTEEISRPGSYIIRPKYSEISEFCTKLTTITQELIDGGLPFPDSVADFEYMEDTKNCVWASWGDYDRKMFEKNCDLYKVPYPFGDTHINLKSLFALKRKHDREVGMERALEILGIPLEGTHHRGCDDAKNIAKIARWIFWG